MQNYYLSKSKETYGQTRGLSNLEMKHNDELVIIGVFLRAFKTSRVRTTQGRTYLRKRSFFSLAFVARCKIAAEHGVLKAKGSSVTQDTPAKKN